MLLFLAWWGRSVAQMVRSPASDQFAYAGAIASAALLVHSLVDFPLRTAAMSAVFAMSPEISGHCGTLRTIPEQSQRSDDGGLH